MKKIDLYYKKTNYYKLSFFYKREVKENYLLNVDIFYILYRKFYFRSIKGLCVKKKNNIFSNNESFKVYFKYKNIEVNQIFFLVSPFILLIKRKKSYSFSKLYIL